MMVLVAVPGEAAERALPMATWVAVDRSGMSQAQRKRTSAYALDVDDRRLDKLAMRQKDGGREREVDWTTSAETTTDQYTSSRGYVMGLAIGLLTPSKAKRYLQEGRSRC